MKRKFEIGDIVILNNGVEGDSSVRGWLEDNPLGVGKVVSLYKNTQYPIGVTSYTNDCIVCYEKELTLVGRNEKKV